MTCRVGPADGGRAVLAEQQARARSHDWISTDLPQT
jgi:hypothetical protein